MLNTCSSEATPSTLANLLSRPEFGAASNSHAIAPRNGGVTNEAVTSARTVRRNGMSVRATNQPIGAATAQQMTADDVARITVVRSGLVKVGSVTSVTKFCSVKPPALSVTLKYTSHDIGSTISAIRIGQERSSRVRRTTGAERARVITLRATPEKSWYTAL